MIINERVTEYNLDTSMGEPSDFLMDHRTLSKTKISIVIPMYNEARSIGFVLDRIPKFPNYEVIVVDDGSTDGSREVVRRYSNVKLICNKRNFGYGRALLEGIKHASGDIIIHLDSDGQHDPSDIPRMVKPILSDEADITVGSRYKGCYYYRLPFSTRVGEAFIELLLKIFFSLSVKANQGGFRAFKREVKEDIFKDIKYYGFIFATETLIKAGLSHRKVREVPIRLYGRSYGRSHVQLPKFLFSLIKCVIYYSIYKAFGHRWSERISRFYKNYGIYSLLKKIHLLG
ncbi:MAG: glycosyltransferase family 2 protein [Promethearchaeota archaeon]